MREKTSPKHFKMFKNEFNYWVDKFGLTGWKIDFEHGGGEDVDDANAWLNVHSVKGRLVTAGLAKTVDCLEDISQYAFHEVSELLLTRIMFIAECRYCQPEEITEECHNLIRILENVVFKNQRVQTS